MLGLEDSAELLPSYQLEKSAPEAQRPGSMQHSATHITRRLHRLLNAQVCVCARMRVCVSVCMRVCMRLCVPTVLGTRGPVPRPLAGVHHRHSVDPSSIKHEVLLFTEPRSPPSVAMLTGEQGVAGR
jgi:hypothetical protein